MLIDAIWDWNPWWNDATRIEGLTGHPRDELNGLLATLTERKVTILSGVRRAGKTTLMHQMIKHLLESGVHPTNILFLGLEDPAFVAMGLDELITEYRREHSPDGMIYMFLDEVQSKTGWERVLRKEMDIRSDVTIVVSGSSSSLLSGEYATLLTGRNITCHIRPLSFRNYHAFMDNTKQPSSHGTEWAEKTMALFRMYLEVGGFPEVVLQSEEQRKTTLVQYFNDIVHRDIVHLHAADARKVHTMASYMLMNIGNQFSLSSLRKALGLSFDAIRDYLSYLEQAGLFHFIREFSFSPKPVPKESGKWKIYCADVGMAKAVHGRHSRDYGRFAENAVYLELIQRGLAPGFFKGRKEVDFVVVGRNREITLINVCMARDIPEREFDGIHEFIQAHPKARVSPFILTDNREGEVDGIALMPVWKWLLEPVS